MACYHLCKCEIDKRILEVPPPNSPETQGLCVSKTVMAVLLFPSVISKSCMTPKVEKKASQLHQQILLCMVLQYSSLCSGASGGTL